MLHNWQDLTAEQKQTIMRGVVDDSVYAGPYHAEFSPTDACNYECFFCSTAHVDRRKRLSWDRLSDVLTEMIGMGLQSVRLSGGGEPLIYPQIDRFLDLCLANRVSVSNLTTNGFKLTPAVIDYLLRLDTEEIIISFNDLDAESYAATNGTTSRSYDVVLDNVRNLIAERRRRNLTKPNIVMQFFLWKSNYDRIERGYDLGLELDADTIYIRDMWGLKRDERMTPAQLQSARSTMERIIERDREHRKLVTSFANEKVLDEVATFSEQQTMKHRTPGRLGVEDPSRKEYCYIAWYSTVIWGSGNVYPCCQLATSEGYPPLGNITGSSFQEIWEGPAYAKLRTELREIAIFGGRFDDSREHCYARKACSMHHACPIVAGLADPEFYDEAFSEIQKLRRGPGVTARRWSEAIMTHRPFIGASKP